MKTRLLGMMIAIVALMSGSALHGDTPCVAGIYWPLQQGYRVELTVYNALTEGNVRSLFIPTSDSADAEGPIGWAVYHTSREVSWSINSAYGIPPNGSLGGFCFSVQDAPSTMQWSIQGGASDYQGDVTPVLIPEPSSLAALGIGLGGLMLRRRKR